MTDNRTTELRAKLTERGVDWLDESNGYADVTTFIANGAKWTVISKSYLNPEHDWMTLRAERITPEQAIAATLGSGTCELTEVEKDCDTASEWMLDRFFVYDSVYECSCGETFGHVARNRPSFCPNCGRKVVSA